MCPLGHWRKITLKRISLEDKGPQGGWDQTAAQSSIIFSHIILISMTDNKISVQLMAALGFKWNPLWH